MWISIRRRFTFMTFMMMRKKRCFFLVVFSCIVLTFLSSWLRAILETDNHPESVLPSGMPSARVEPQLNVLAPPNLHTNESSYSEQQGSQMSNTASVVGQTTIQVKANTIQAVSATRLFQNQSEDIEVVKNKTLSQMAVMGSGQEGEKRLPKIVFVKQIWNLSVSFEDIGNIMKNTAFLNKLKPLNLSNPTLTSNRNRTANFSLTMPLRQGYCDCWEHYCYCCVQLVNAQLHLSNKTCANFTFVSKSHELNFTLSIDSKPVYSGVVSADAPPLLCLGSIPTLADVCFHFSNMTYKVDGLGFHKSQILGCTDFSLNIYNKTVSVFPVDCFQIPGDPNHHPKDSLLLPNFVP